MDGESILLSFERHLRAAAAVTVMCSDHCIRLSAALQVCFVAEMHLMMFVSVPLQCSIRFTSASTHH